MTSVSSRVIFFTSRLVLSSIISRLLLAELLSLCIRLIDLLSCLFLIRCCRQVRVQHHQYQVPTVSLIANMPLFSPFIRSTFIPKTYFWTVELLRRSKSSVSSSYLFTYPWFDFFCLLLTARPVGIPKPGPTASNASGKYSFSYPAPAETQSIRWVKLLMIFSGFVKSLLHRRKCRLYFSSKYPRGFLSHMFGLLNNLAVFSSLVTYPQFDFSLSLTVRPVGVPKPGSSGSSDGKYSLIFSGFLKSVIHRQ